MTEPIVTAIDEKGNLNIPNELRKHLNWGTGDEIEISCLNGLVMLELSRQYDGPLCVICDKPERVTRINGRDICKSCVEGVRNSAA